MTLLNLGQSLQRTFAEGTLHQIGLMLQRAFTE